MSAAVGGEGGEGAAAARVGQVLKDKWRLDGLLGIGGMAVVYAATHRNQKRVAIKVLLPELAGNPDVRNRFVREGYAANTIEHPGALSVLDDDVTEDGLPFLVMELLDGETVDARWERSERRLELAEVLTIGGAVLDVLAAAHAKGVVHRDVKPENLFLLRRGGLKVLDFGIARVLEGTRSGTETRAGMVMGTPAFMAPEQALAKWGDVDGRTDLWAVAATMFTLLSGSHVHEGENANEQFVKSATQPARSIGTCVKGLPRSVVALIDRALRFDRTARWPDARAMQEAVMGAYEALTGTPLVIAPPSGIQSGGTWSGGGAIALLPPPSRATREPARSTQTRAKTPPRPPPRRARTGTFDATGGTLPSRVHSTFARGALDLADPFMSPDPAPALAPPPMAALTIDAFLAGRTAERDEALAEVARCQPIVAEIQGRLAGVRRRAAQVQEQIATTRKERTAEEERFRRQMNARLEGVGEARKEFRSAMGEVARIALADPDHFPPEVGAAERAAVERTGSMALTRAEEDAIHRAAVSSFDPSALRRGIALSSLLLMILIGLAIMAPVVIRSYIASQTGKVATPPTTDPPPEE